jgi:hypothetical protein
VETGGLLVADTESQWRKAQDALQEARAQTEAGSTSEQFQTVGLLCRELLITVAQAVYDPSRHPVNDGVTPGPTDAKRMLGAYFEAELAGSSHQSARKYAKSLLDLANDLQHRRNADYRDAALCLEATDALVRLVTVLSGRSMDASRSRVEVQISYEKLRISADEHLYGLRVKVRNPTLRSIPTFRLDLSFPDLPSIPLRWQSLRGRPGPTGPLLEISATDPAVSVFRSRRYQNITYRSPHALLPQETVDLSESIGLRYRFTDDVYSNVEDFPVVEWTVYADGISPAKGSVPLTELNVF